MKLLNKETIETIYEKATDILATVGVEFEMDSAIGLFKKMVPAWRGKESLSLRHC